MNTLLKYSLLIKDENFLKDENVKILKTLNITNRVLAILLTNLAVVTKKNVDYDYLKEYYGIYQLVPHPISMYLVDKVIRLLKNDDNMREKLEEIGL